MKVTLERKEPINHNVTTFWWRTPRKVDFTPGQFTELYLPHKNADERGQKHWFTISASPTEKLWSNTTKFAGKDKSSTFKKTLFALKPGAKVDAAEPMGDFVLPKDKSIPLVFVAGGIGITPFRSIIKWLIDTGENRDIELIYAVGEPKDAVFVDLFEQYGVNPKLVISSEGEKLTAEKILALTPGWKNKRIYVSGPEPMVETLTKDLEKLGVPKNDLVSDYFPGYDPI